MDLSGDKSASYFDYLKFIIKSELADVGCAIPAIVESFDPATQMIEAVPVIRRRKRLEDGLTEVEDRPKQIKIPLCTPYVRMLGFSLTMPLSPGDHVMLVIQDRGIDEWQETGEISDPPDIDSPRTHNYTDAIYVIGPIPLSDPIEDYQIDCTELRNRDRTTAVTIWEEEAEVRATPGNYTDWQDDGDVTTFATKDISEIAVLDKSEYAGKDITEVAMFDIKNIAGAAINLAAGTTITLTASALISITSAVAVEIVAPVITLNTPQVIMTGNLQVAGEIVGGSLAAPSAVIDGVEHASHVHEEFGTYTGPAE